MKRYGWPGLVMAFGSGFGVITLYLRTLAWLISLKPEQLDQVAAYSSDITSILLLSGVIALFIRQRAREQRKKQLRIVPDDERRSP